MKELFVVVISNTKLANIKGITVAGAKPELIKYTPPADVEFLFYDKPLCIDAIPVTPEGYPTPAIITKASYNLAEFPIVVVRAGSEIEPLVPHIKISEKVGGDIRFEKGVEDIYEILRKSELFGRELKKSYDELVIGESTPAGTTTALAVLRALGYRAKVSSSMANNPIELKEKVVEEAFKSKGVEFGELRDDPLKAIELFGDPMQACVVGLARGFKKNVVLAGGTQMLPIAHALNGECTIATTKYIINDKTSNFLDIADEIGVEVYEAKLDFSKSRFKGLRMYEGGYVKEGVGAGGSVYLAEKHGFNVRDVVEEVERIYEKITSPELRF